MRNQKISKENIIEWDYQNEQSEWQNTFFSVSLGLL